MSEPPKLCECGCGKPTPISKYTDNRTGAKRGQPTRFIRGHVANLPDSPVRRAANAENQRRKEAVAGRRKRIAGLYREGKSFKEIVEATGATREIVAEDIRKMRLAGHAIPYRNVPTAWYVDDETASVVIRLWDREELTTREVAMRLGWEPQKAQTVIFALRRAGRIKLRHAEIQLPPEERRRVVREFNRKRRGLEAGRKGDKTKIVLRLLETLRRPASAIEVAQFLRRVGIKISNHAVHGLLRYMADREVIAKVEIGEGARWFERVRWFIPVGFESPPESLTLADAERETELAALIEAQEAEVSAGDWVKSESGHFMDASLDAPITEDGFTILDTLGDEDEQLADLMEEYA